MIERINIGIVGAGGRSASLKAALDITGTARVHAVCDIDAGRREESKRYFGAPEMYEAYSEMIARSDIDAVIISTPMMLHAPQSVEALAKNIHVLSEVTAAVSMDECRALVAAAAASKALFLMAENYIYTRANSMVRELARRNMFDVPYYAEAEYIHELKQLNEETPWRRRWQTGVNGITYGTHSLGPVLTWFPGERVTAVSCAGSGHHYRDARNSPYENEDTCVMLCRMSGGGLVKIRVDMLSERPHAMTNYSLQGTGGCYESARAEGEKNRIWLASKRQKSWSDLWEFEREFLPEVWKRYASVAEKMGHGGSDLFTIIEFLSAVRDNRAPDTDIHAAMDMTAPGLVAQESIANNHEWLPVPDSRTWIP
jgi:predicted dehydrogenase